MFIKLAKSFFVIVLFLIWMSEATFAQYPPQARMLGSDAVYYQDTAIKGWGTTCQVKRGRVDISDTLSDYATAGEIEDGIGKALANGTVSLGDGGSAIVGFKHPIINGIGADFAVFENGIRTKDSLGFLELGFVEVSSNGINFVRFPAYSNNDTVNQFHGFYEMNARSVKNLAGKYISGYGTPFDLDELKDSPNLNIQRITHVKIVDVVGSIDKRYASLDVNGRAINDPFPTPFPSSGFDLDAVGVIHSSTEVGVDENGFNQNEIQISAYPNPVKDVLNIKPLKDGQIKIMNSYGKVIFQRVIQKNETAIENLIEQPSGMYFLTYQTQTTQITIKFMKR
jgi:hypothetical protein